VNPPKPNANTNNASNEADSNKINIAIDIARMASFLHSPSNPKRAQQPLIAEVLEAQKMGRFAKEAGTTWLKHIFGNDPKSLNLVEYTAPELKANSRISNEPADVFAFSAMLKNLLKGEVMSPTVDELIKKCCSSQLKDRPSFDNCLDTLLLELIPPPKVSHVSPASEFIPPSDHLDSLPMGVPLSQPAPQKSYIKKIDVNALGLVGGSISSSPSQLPSKEQQLREEKQREIEKLRKQHKELQARDLSKRGDVEAAAKVENEIRENKIKEREEQKRREEEERRRKEEEERRRREEEERRRREELRRIEEEERVRREEDRIRREEERARIQREQWQIQQRRDDEYRRQREEIMKNKKNSMCPANIHSVGQFCSIINGIWRG